MLAYGLLSLISILLGIISVLWYNARKAARSESIADAEKQARVEADRRTEALETAALQEEAAARVRDTDEGSEVVRSGDADAAGGYLLQSFPPRTRKP